MAIINIYTSLGQQKYYITGDNKWIIIVMELEV
jgi:hypothetical protein